MHLAADGLQSSSRPRFPWSRSLGLRGPRPLRSWGWTLIAGRSAADPIADRMRGAAGRQADVHACGKAIEDWRWFEDVLAYDNARLPQALIQTGLGTRTPSYVEAGRQSLRWLMLLQTSPSGCFRPVGTESFGRVRQKPEAFDQQPVEAAATISACLSAWQVDRGAEWRAGATRAFDWFLGKNDLQTTLIDPAPGSCLDGLHPDRPNENKGAELVLSYLLGLVEMRQFKRTATIDRKTAAVRHVRIHGNGSIAPRMPPGGHFVSIPILESADPLPATRSGQGRRQTLQAGD